MSKISAQVAIIMGSQSDWPTMHHTATILNELRIDYDAKIVSAHRTPERLYDFAKNAKNMGYNIIVAGAGGAAHLPGMTAALTTLPVIGVPINRTFAGTDSLLSIVQMPSGTPVATMAIGKAGAINAALFSAAILALNDTDLAERVANWHQAQRNAIPLQPNQQND